ncbi:hypothetical protein TNCV_3515081 [Trichonephila clavipes]|nr:hypothetical protein TNCV_3515081 [Trichonephila clavipes]
MVWIDIAYGTRSPLIFIHGIMTAQWYAYKIIDTHALPLMAGFPGAIYHKTMLGQTKQGHHKTASAILPPYPGLLKSQICHLSSLYGFVSDGKLDNL